MKRVEDGSVALITIIILTILLVSVGSSLVLSSADYLISGRDFSERVTLDLVKRTCFEEGMHHLKLNKSYTGEFTYTRGTETCTVNVSQEGGSPNKRLIHVVATHGTYSLTDSFHVDTTVKPYVVTH